MAGIATDDLQVVSTDHCPFCFNEQPFGIKYSKQQGRANFSKIPNGVPGIETRLPLIYDGSVGKHGMSLNRFVEMTATTPAKLFGLFPKKGTIAVGSDADIVVFDPCETWTVSVAEHHSHIDYSLFDARTVTGRVRILSRELISIASSGSMRGVGRILTARPFRRVLTISGHSLRRASVLAHPFSSGLRSQRAEASRVGSGDLTPRIVCRERGHRDYSVTCH